MINTTNLENLGFTFYTTYARYDTIYDTIDVYRTQ